MFVVSGELLSYVYNLLYTNDIDTYTYSHMHGGREEAVVGGAKMLAKPPG